MCRIVNSSIIIIIIKFWVNAQCRLVSALQTSQRLFCYMVVMNLPRSERFKRENVIIVEIIPALSKEPQSLNYFLNPLVDHLNALWHCVKVKTWRSPTEGAEVRAALMLCIRHTSCS